MAERRKKAGTTRKAAEKTLTRAKLDAELAAVARSKIVPMTSRDDFGDAAIGHPFWHPGERVVRHDVLTWRLPQGRDWYEDEVIHVLLTSSKNSLSAYKNGRILITMQPDGFVTYGGIFFIEEYGRKSVQSIWIAPDFRGIGFGKLLADVAKGEDITTVVKPISAAGRAWAARYRFRVID